MKVCMEQWCNCTDRGNPYTWRKTCPSATLSITNLIWTGLVSNLCHSSERLAVNCLIHGMALKAKDPVHTSQRTHDSISTTIELILYRGKVAFYAVHFVDHIKWLY